VRNYEFWAESSSTTWSAESMIDENKGVENARHETGRVFALRGAA
jgi:hypothetical protein